VCLALLESREEISPFIEGDFQEYVTEMADVQTWGGEPELAIAAGVLQLPVTVYQQEQACGPTPPTLSRAVHCSAVMPGHRHASSALASGHAKAGDSQLLLRHCCGV